MNKQRGHLMMKILVCVAIGIVLLFEFQVAQAELVMHLEFEGDLEDTSDFGNNAIIGNSGQLISFEPNGRIGTALRFAGVDASAPPWIEVASSSSLSPGSAITMAAWVFKTGQIGGNAGIFFKGNLVGVQPDWQLGLDHDGVSNFGPISGFGAVNGCGIACSEAIAVAPLDANGVPMDEWSHFAATYDGQILKLYIDGRVIASDEHFDTIEQTGAPLYIGNRFLPSGNVGSFQGLFDDLRVYDVALSEAELWELALNDDGDGIAAINDNCFIVSNPSQRDTDADSFGNACDADLNNDCIVNIVDLGILRSVFFTNDPDADFNGDGVVNVVDLGIMRSLFSSPPGPSGIPNNCG